jgi:pimeloyl-ACP methyl ester carboxylesterase
MTQRACGRAGWVSLALALLCAAQAQPAAGACDPDSVQASGAVFRICMPDDGKWNRNLVIWAHGYVAFNEPVAIPEGQLTLPDGTRLSDLVTGLGYAFATTSYSVNGLAVRQGLEDVVELVGLFASKKGEAARIYLVGASEGGLITALAIERFPEVFAGGLATCGPIGSFARQVNYLGDARVLFDYYYPGLLPGEGVSIPQEFIEGFEAHYERVIRPQVFAADKEGRTREWITVADLPADPLNFWPTAEHSVRDVLWYNVFATNDGTQKLGGQAFDNVGRAYAGSGNDAQLNAAVRRFSADPAALGEIAAQYDTTGKLLRPLVTLHTLRDQQVPFWHEGLYLQKATAAGSADKLTQIPADRYGHCSFSSAEILLAFGTLIQKVEGAAIPNAGALLKSGEARAEYERLARRFGLRERR